MVVTFFTDYEIVKKMRTCYLVRIFFDTKGNQTVCFYLSEKQMNKLRKVYDNFINSSVKRTKMLGVFDGDRFVWCGIEYPDYTDRDWLMKNFNAEFKEYFSIEKEIIVKHVPEKMEPVETQPDADLIR